MELPDRSVQIEHLYLSRVNEVEVLIKAAHIVKGDEPLVFLWMQISERPPRTEESLILF